jgi:hypothetical protein
MNLKKKLLCVGQLSNPSGQTSSADSTYTDVSTINCYVYGGDKRVISRGIEEDITLDFNVLVDNTVIIKIDGKFSNVVDPVGNLLIEEGRVVSVTPIVHSRKGLVAQEVGVVRW